MSNKNKTAQVIILKDGGQKVIHHEKKTNGPSFGNFKEYWNAMNKAPKENSKRQQKLRALPVR